jgi:hypothetical protein
VAEYALEREHVAAVEEVVAGECVAKGVRVAAGADAGARPEPREELLDPGQGQSLTGLVDD